MAIFCGGLVVLFQNCAEEKLEGYTPAKTDSGDPGPQNCTTNPNLFGCSPGGPSTPPPGSNALMVWSNNGQVAGKSYCKQIREAAEFVEVPGFPLDPNGRGWGNNYICANEDLQLEFFTGGDPRVGVANSPWRCAHINEAADAHTWDDNYLCTLRTDINLTFSSHLMPTGANPSRCINMTEPQDPAGTWNDNYLCW